MLLVRRVTEVVPLCCFQRCCSGGLGFLPRLLSEKAMLCYWLLIAKVVNKTVTLKLYYIYWVVTLVVPSYFVVTKAIAPVVNGIFTLNITSWCCCDCNLGYYSLITGVTLSACFVFNLSLKICNSEASKKHKSKMRLKWWG